MGSVTLTEKAITELKKIMEEQNLPVDVALRLGVKDGGCSGFSYAMGFDEGKPTELDIILKVHDIPVYVDKKSMLYLDNITIDFHENSMQRGFVFQNPNASGTCGGGTSFPV